MVVIQQYVIGLAFFGFLGFALGLIREFRALKKVTRTTKLTTEERRQLISRGVKALGSMTLWWTAMYIVVIGISAIG